MSEMIRKIGLVSAAAIISFWHGAYGEPTAPESGSQPIVDGCEVTSHHCIQDSTLFDVTDDSMDKDPSSSSSQFLPGEWTPSFSGARDSNKGMFREDPRDNFAEGSLRGGGIDPAFPGGGGSTPTSLGTVDSYRY